VFGFKLATRRVAIAQANSLYAMLHNQLVYRSTTHARALEQGGRAQLRGLWSWLADIGAARGSCRRQPDLIAALLPAYRSAVLGRDTKATMPRTVLPMRFKTPPAYSYLDGPPSSSATRGLDAATSRHSSVPSAETKESELLLAVQPRHAAPAQLWR
jgi:hypothetical protein